MKRNTESKCRQKIINECNLNKEQQRELDIICKNHGCKYKWIYDRMPYYRKRQYVEKLFEIFPKNEVKYSKFNNLFICFKAAFISRFLLREGN